MNLQTVTFATALVAGLLSFFSPCVFPLVPVYIGYMTGQVAGKGSSRLGAFLHALSFVLGFGAVFALLGATAGLLGAVIYPALPYVAKVGGILLLVMGLHMTGAISIPFLNAEKRLEMSGRQPGSYWTSALVGVVFAVGWTPCVGPVLAAILLLAANSQTVTRGAVLLGVYALGLGVPFLLFGGLLDVLAPVLRRIARYLRVFQILGGLLLIIMGFLLLTGLFDRLSALLDALGSGL